MQAQHEGLGLKRSAEAPADLESTDNKRKREDDVKIEGEGAEDDTTPDQSTPTQQPNTSTSATESQADDRTRKSIKNKKVLAANWEFIKNRTNWGPAAMKRLKDVATGHVYTSNLRAFVDMSWKEFADKMVETAYNRVVNTKDGEKPNMRLQAVDIQRAMRTKADPTTIIPNEQLHQAGFYRDKFGLPMPIVDVEPKPKKRHRARRRDSQQTQHNQQVHPMQQDEQTIQTEQMQDTQQIQETHQMQQIQPVQPIQLMEQMQQAQPIQQLQQAQPVEQMHPIQPIQPIEQAEPVQRMEDMHQAQRVQEPQEIQHTQQIQPIQPIQQAQEVQQIQQPQTVNTPVARTPAARRSTARTPAPKPPSQTPKKQTAKSNIFNMEPKWSMKILPEDIPRERIIELLDLHDLTPDPKEAIVKDGVMTLRGCCKHWDKHYVKGEPSLKEMAEQEALAYEFHGRNSDEAMERLWVMQFAVTQQAARMDVVLYLLNLLSRTDRQYQLFSYPEPALFSWNGKDDERARIHGNPHEFYDPNGMPAHSSHPLWFGLLVPSGQEGLAAPIGVAYPPKAAKELWNSVQEEDVIRKDVKEQDVKLRDAEVMGKWLDVQAADGNDLSVTGFHTLTPIIIPSPTEKMLYFPLRYMAKNHTGNDLEISGLGGFQGLRKANETLTSPFYLPSGQQLNHRIRRAWEPSVRVLPSSAISAALLGLMPWEQTSVIVELTDLFLRDLDNAKKLMRRMQKELHRQTLRAFIEFRRAEMHVFGDNSAFLHLQQQQENTPPAEEPDTQRDEAAVKEEDDDS